MAINSDKPRLWKDDVMASVALYNTWFLDAAPRAYREQRKAVVDVVTRTLEVTNDFRNITPEVLQSNPGIISVLRMATAPPIARDRLTGLADVPKAFHKTLEQGALPPRMGSADLMRHLSAMCDVVTNLLDLDLFPWITNGTSRTPQRERDLAEVVVADRLCGSQADPIVRNAQETRQLALIEDWLVSRGYKKKAHPASARLQDMEAGTFWFRMNVSVRGETGGRTVNIPIDAVVQPLHARRGSYPVLIEAKSAGDFTNTNKRRKEEAQKVHQLRATYGEHISLLLFLCGYFDSGYLGYEAAEGLDWVWEHRVDDLRHAGL